MHHIARILWNKQIRTGKLHRDTHSRDSANLRPTWLIKTAHVHKEKEETLTDIQGCDYTQNEKKKSEGKTVGKASKGRSLLGSKKAGKEVRKEARGASPFPLFLISLFVPEVVLPHPSCTASQSSEEWGYRRAAFPEDFVTDRHDPLIGYQFHNGVTILKSFRAGVDDKRSINNFLQSLETSFFSRSVISPMNFNSRSS